MYPHWSRWLPYFYYLAAGRLRILERESAVSIALHVGLTIRFANTTEKGAPYVPVLSVMEGFQLESFIKTPEINSLTFLAIHRDLWVENCEIFGKVAKPLNVKPPQVS